MRRTRQRGLAAGKCLILRTAMLAWCIFLRADAGAQDALIKGVVWTQPAEIPTAYADLVAMRDMGVDAVRTDIVTNTHILAAADSLGMQLFQELPVAHYTAATLLDTLAFAQRVLAQAMVRSAPYAAARHFGLANLSDTSTPDACAYFEALSSAARRLPGARTYYNTPFTHADQCAYAVDLVLLDALEEADPAAMLRGWPHATPAGLATVGRYANEDVVGLLHPRSPESQARYLETHLNTLVGSDAAAAFVFRWRDPERSSGAYAPPGVYGLSSHAGHVRPSFFVVQGIFSGEQRAFAFAQGAHPHMPIPWHMLAGWLAIGLLGLMFYSSTRFRQTLHRYFFSHHFFVESIRDGREVLRASTGVFLIAQALCASVILSCVMQMAQHHAALNYVLAKMPPLLVDLAGPALHQSWTLIALCSALFVVLALLAVLVVAVLYRWIRRFTVAKAYVMMVWPLWPVIPLAWASLAIMSLPGPQALRGMVTICAFGLALAMAAVVRIVADLSRLDPTHSARVVLYFFCLCVLVAAGLALTFFWIAPEWADSLAFFLHLLTRT